MCRRIFYHQFTHHWTSFQPRRHKPYFQQNRHTTEKSTFDSSFAAEYQIADHRQVTLEADRVILIKINFGEGICAMYSDEQHTFTLGYETPPLTILTSPTLTKEPINKKERKYLTNNQYNNIYKYKMKQNVNMLTCKLLTRGSKREFDKLSFIKGFL